MAGPGQDAADRTVADATQSLIGHIEPGTPCPGTATMRRVGRPGLRRFIERRVKALEGKVVDDSGSQIAFRTLEDGIPMSLCVSLTYRFTRSKQIAVALHTLQHSPNRPVKLCLCYDKYTVACWPYCPETEVDIPKFVFEYLDTCEEGSDEFFRISAPDLLAKPFIEDVLSRIQSVQHLRECGCGRPHSSQFEDCGECTLTMTEEDMQPLDAPCMVCLGDVKCSHGHRMMCCGHKVHKKCFRRCQDAGMRCPNCRSTGDK